MRWAQASSRQQPCLPNQVAPLAAVADSGAVVPPLLSLPFLQPSKCPSPVSVPLGVGLLEPRLYGQMPPPPRPVQPPPPSADSTLIGL